ncbi:MAG: CcmD family protein [Chloroflexi bacterium]|nr:CcmD family protein [Chloroflexota bacterium]
MQSFEFLFAAFTVTWLVLFGYAYLLSRQVVGLHQEVEALRADVLPSSLHESAGSASASVPHSQPLTPPHAHSGGAEPGAEQAAR